MRQRVTILKQLPTEGAIEFEMRIQQKTDELQESEFIDSLIKPTWFYNDTMDTLTCILEYEEKDNILNNDSVVCILYTPDLESVLLFEKDQKWQLPSFKVKTNETPFSSSTSFFHDKTGMHLMPTDWRQVGEMQKAMSGRKYSIMCAIYEKEKNGAVDNWKSVGAKWTRINELPGTTTDEKMIAHYGSYVLGQTGQHKLHYSVFKYTL